MDWTKYARAFFWRDGENPEQFGSYKLGYADIVDGDLKAVPRGIFAVAGVLQGARGGADIPEAEQNSIKTQVGRYYQKMSDEYGEDLTPPWSKEAEPPAERKQATLMTRLEANLRMTAAFCITDWLGDGTIDAVTVDALNSGVDASMMALRQSVPGSIADLPLMSYWNANDPEAQKAGRMISGANRDKIQAAIDVLQGLLDAADPQDVQLQNEDHNEAKSGIPPALTGSPAAASITDQADIDRERESLAILMEMVT